MASTERANSSPAFSAWGGIGASFTPFRISHMCEDGLYFSHETDHHGQAETAYGCSFVFVFRLSFYNVSRKGFTALFRSYRRVSTARKEADQIESGMTGIITCQSYQIFYWQVSLRHQDFFIYWPIPAARKYLTG